MSSQQPKKSKPTIKETDEKRSTLHGTHNVGNVSERDIRAIRRNNRIAKDENINETSKNKIEPTIKTIMTREKQKLYNITPESEEPCKRQLEKICEKQVCRSKKGKSKVKPSPLVPLTASKNKELFEKVTAGINNDAAKFVGINSSECNKVNNITSTSEYKDFKEGNFEVLTSVDPITTMRERVGRCKRNPGRQTNCSQLEKRVEIKFDENKKPQNFKRMPREKKNNKNILLKNKKQAKTKPLQKLPTIEEERESPSPALLFEESIKKPDVEASTSSKTLSQHIRVLSPQDLELQVLNSSERKNQAAIGENFNQNDASRETSSSAKIQEGSENNYSQKDNSKSCAPKTSKVIKVTRSISRKSRSQEVSSAIDTEKANITKKRLVYPQETSSNMCGIKVIPASGQSISSVHECSIKEVPESLAASVGHSKDGTQCISKKDLEMDQLKKKFAKSFKEMKQYQDDMEKRKRQLNNDASKKVHNLLVDFNERCAEMKEELTRELKDRAIKLISEDHQYKQAFVVMLREDVETAMKQIGG